MSVRLQQRTAEGSPPKVVVAIEPRVYREVIGKAIRTLRPHLKVVVAAPEEIGREETLSGDGVVICDRSPVTDEGPTWIEYRPYGGASANVRMAGKRSVIHNVGLEDLLRLVDETEKLVHAGVGPR